jgi:hypothetical protein
MALNAFFQFRNVIRFLDLIDPAIHPDLGPAKVASRDLSHRSIMPHPVAKVSKEGFSYIRPHLRPYRPLRAGERRDHIAKLSKQVKIDDVALRRFTEAAPFLEAGDITGLPPRLTTRRFVSVCSSRQRDDCRLALVSTVETLFAGPWSWAP